MAVAEAECNTVIELKLEHHALQCDGIQLFLAVYRQVRSFGQVLARCCHIAKGCAVKEADRHAGLLGDLRVSRHLPALVVGHALVHRQRHAIERRAEAFQRRGGRRVVHLDQNR